MIYICGNGGLKDYVTDRLEKSYEGEAVQLMDCGELNSHIFDESDQIFLAVSWHEAYDWMKLISVNGGRNIFRIPVYVKQYELPLRQSDLEQYRIVNLDATLKYLETHVTDICNLKCRGCMHFSNVAEEENFPDLDNFEKDFQRLSELFPQILIIRLMGGEPLLNPDLPEYLRIARKYYPSAELRIVTNGLLIPHQKSILWEKVRECHAAVDISPYPPTIRMIDKIRTILDQQGIPYGNIAEELKSFRKSLTLSDQNDVTKSSKICGSSHCRFLRNGKISKCPLPQLIDSFNKKYGQSFPEGEVFDIYEDFSGEELNRLLNEPIKLCSYCPDEEKFQPWSRTIDHVELSDWIADTE